MASSPDRLFRRALTSLQAGALTDAEHQFKELLDDDPRHVAGLNLIAVLLTRLGRFDEAEHYIQRALRENSASDASFNNYGIILRALKRPTEALEQFSHALEINPSDAGTWNSRGAVRNELGNHQEAIADFEKAISLNPKYADAYCNKAASLAALHLWEQSLAAYDAALAANSKHVGGWLGRGNVLLRLKRYKEAAAAYDEALLLQPNLADAWIGGGKIYSQLRLYDKALEAYDNAIALNPNSPHAWVGRGNVLYETRSYNEAATAYDKALEFSPDIPGAWLGRGSVYAALGRHQEAAAAYDKVIALNASLPHGWAARGGIFFGLGLYDDALRCYEKAISIDPEFASAHYEKAQILLLRGDFKEGWHLFEWRWKTGLRAFSRRNFSEKLWLGDEAIEGKTIAVHSEQGLGDTIQFYRYLQKLEALDCKIIFETPAALYNLFKAQNPPFTIITQGDEIPEFEFHCPLMSLPLAFRTEIATIPAPVPYLVAPPEKVAAWREKLGRKTKPRIGLCWSGSPGSMNDLRRTMPLESLLPILTQDAEWHSLQKDIRDHDRYSFESAQSIKDHTQDLTDFTDTAALLGEMDLVISVDAVVGHLAGAVGVPLWSLQPFVPDFRWLQDREDSPWYPTARLFRQRFSGDWIGIIDRVRSDLEAGLRTGFSRRNTETATREARRS